MFDKTLVTLIILDLFIIGVLILYGFNGFRRGGIKSLLSLFFLYISFIATMLLYERPAMYMQVELDTNSSLSKIVFFAIIFAIIATVTRYIYYFLTKMLADVLLRGLISGVIGAFFGLMEGILIIGIVFMCIAFYPVSPPLSDTVSFKILKEIPIDVRDSSLWFLPKMRDSIKQEEQDLEKQIKQKRDIMKEYGLPDK
jgi:uncharacterized membrane protein required for colicin V production